MIAALLLPFLLAAADRKAPKPLEPPASIDGLPVGGLPEQTLPARGCAAYLFSAGGTKTLAAMAVADPAALRVRLDGTVTDYARATQSGPGGFGFSGTTEYRGGDVTATLDMTIETRADVTQGAVVRDATLRIDRPGRDSVVMPVAGLIGCR